MKLKNVEVQQTLKYKSKLQNIYSDHNIVLDTTDKEKKLNYILICNLKTRYKDIPEKGATPIRSHLQSLHCDVKYLEISFWSKNQSFKLFLKTFEHKLNFLIVL